MSIKYTVTKPEKRTQHSSYAAWYTNGVIEPGVYEADHSATTQANRKCQPGENVYWLYLKLPGTVTDDYFQSHFGGMPMGQTYDRTQNAGKEITFTGQPYGYDVAESIAHYASTKWSIDDDWKVECHPDRSINDKFIYPDGTVGKHLHSLVRVSGEAS